MKKILIGLTIVGIAIAGIMYYLNSEKEPQKVEHIDSKPEINENQIFEEETEKPKEKESVKKELNISLNDSSKMEPKPEDELKFEKIDSGFDENIRPEDFLASVNKIINEFNESEVSPKDAQLATELHNYIYQSEMYDVFKNENIVYSNTECRNEICKLTFGVNEVEDDLQSRMPKMTLISKKMFELDQLKGMGGTITNDIENKTMDYYFHHDPNFKTENKN